MRSRGQSSRAAWSSSAARTALRWAARSCSYAVLGSPLPMVIRVPGRSAAVKLVDPDLVIERIERRDLDVADAAGGVVIERLAAEHDPRGLIGYESIDLLPLPAGAARIRQGRPAGGCGEGVDVLVAEPVARHVAIGARERVVEGVRGRVVGDPAVLAEDLHAVPGIRGEAEIRVVVGHR